MSFCKKNSTISKRNIKTNYLLEIGFFLLILKTIMSVSILFDYAIWVDDLLQYVGAFFLLIVIVLQKKSIKTLFIYFALLGISAISSLCVGNVNIFLTVITLIAIKDYKLDYIATLLYKYGLFIFLMHVILCLIMAPFDFSLVVPYKQSYVLTLGFVHRNSLSAIIFNFILLWTWLNYSTLKKIDLLFLMGFGLLCFCLMQTKTTLILTTVLVLLVYMTKFRTNKNTNKTLMIFSRICVPVICVAIFFLVSNFTDNGITLLLDKFLTGRLKLGAYLFNRYGLSLFGQKVILWAEWDSIYNLYGKITFDCLYTSLMVNRGIIWIILISYAFYVLSKKNVAKINIFIIMWALSSITEVYALNCYMFFPILVISILFKKNSYCYGIIDNNIVYSGQA